jgi:replicative DNA helicase
MTAVDSLHVEQLRTELEGETNPDRRIWLAEQIDIATGITNYSTPAAPRQLKDGRTFILDAPTHVPAVWGDGELVPWAEGEGLMIAGPQGVGKTAVAQQLANARMGIGGATFLGFSVKVSEQPLLYIAADRPSQIARSWRRMVADQDADLLKERLIVWSGPLPFDIVREPLKLQEMCETYGARTVFIDSVKDIASPLTDDAVGAAMNRARGACIAAGIEYCELHHNRKANADNRKPTALADVYGSVWLTAGSGSVISLWGDPGDPIIELTHLKQPAHDIGPLELEHDHSLGRTTLRDRPTVESMLDGAGTLGITAPNAAAAIYGPNLTKSQIEKVRRRLQRLADDGQAIPEKGALRTDPVTYRKATVEQRVAPRVVPRDVHEATRTPENTDHGSYTHPDSPTSLLRERVGRGAERGLHDVDLGPHDGESFEEWEARVEAEFGGAS